MQQFPDSVRELRVKRDEELISSEARDAIRAAGEKRGIRVEFE
jgi:hypothetical protein